MKIPTGCYNKNIWKYESPNIAQVWGKKKEQDCKTLITWFEDLFLIPNNQFSVGLV